MMLLYVCLLGGIINGNMAQNVIHEISTYVILKTLYSDTGNELSCIIENI